MKRSVTLAAVVALGAALAAPVATASPSATSGPSPAADPIETLVRVRLPSSDVLRDLEDAGVDVTHDVAQGPGTSIDATVIVPGDELDTLTDLGGTIIETLPAPSMAEAAREMAGNRAPLTAAEKAAAMGMDGSARSGPASDRPSPTVSDASVQVLRADRFTNPSGEFLSVEVRSDLGRDDQVTVTTDTGETLELDVFVDQGVYLYHRLDEPANTDGVVREITVTSGDGTSVTAATDEWAPGTVEEFPDGFQWGFTDSGYVDATQADDVIEDLAAQYPDLAEIVELPYDTHGYNLPEGAPYELGNPDYPSAPHTVKAIRIGSIRDGSKTGVMMYSQEHAREWVTSLVALETAQRLLHNYGTDPTTTALVDDLDIFVIPMINPDGVAYSLYDNLIQRTNLNVDDCNWEPVPTNDGIDLNRNFTVGSLFDGYVGASTNCRSSGYAGPSELSEAETKNEVWMTETYDNIEFIMNTHSVGGYFMWSPAAYLPDRTPLPRPSLGTEQYFLQASETILSRIKEFRGTVVWPGRTGPVIDVLYSAAGNSGDEHYYVGEGETNEVDIYAWDFEVGASIWNEADQDWDGAPNAFWPPFEEEGFAQAMEFSNGWYGILEVARDFSLDDQGPTSTANVDGRGTYDGPVDVFFDTSEAATIYYTTDGSRPTYDSPQVVQDGVRAGAAPVTISDRGTTVLQWFAVDEAGNVSGGYDPETNSRKGLNRAVIKIRG